MKGRVFIVTALIWLGLINIVSAKELLPWETENVDITTSGIHSVRIDDRHLFFEVPAEPDTGAGRAIEVITRGDKYEDWRKRYGEFDKFCFGMSKDFYSLGMPLFGSYAQFSIQAKLHVKNLPAQRDYPSLRGIKMPPGSLPANSDRGDFSKPEELHANLERMKGQGVTLGYATPNEEVIINGRKWYRYLENSAGLYPDDLNEYYVTGLAPDRYLEVRIRLYPVPVYSDRYPRYAPEEQRPQWMKKAFKYKEQVISSLRITAPEGSKEADLYEVQE